MFFSVSAHKPLPTNCYQNLSSESRSKFFSNIGFVWYSGGGSAVYGSPGDEDAWLAQLRMLATPCPQRASCEDLLIRLCRELVQYCKISHGSS